MSDYAAHGPGKYDDLCTYVREKAEAEGAIILIFNGNKGEGFSVQVRDGETVRRLPDILRRLARSIEEANETAAQNQIKKETEAATEGWTEREKSRLATRTWPYGTQHKAQIVYSVPTQHKTELVNVIACACDELREIFVLVQNPDEPNPEVGSIATIEFTQGGPTGGYWRILKPTEPPRPSGTDEACTPRPDSSGVSS